MGELRNPTTGRSSLHITNCDILGISNMTIEGNQGGSYISGAWLENCDMVSIDTTYFEVLQSATQAPLYVDNCRSVEITTSLLNSQSASLPSLKINNSTVTLEACRFAFNALKAIGKGSINASACQWEGDVDISDGYSFINESPATVGTRGVIKQDLRFQPKHQGISKPYPNWYTDSSFSTGIPVMSTIAGSPTVTRDTLHLDTAIHFQ